FVFRNPFACTPKSRTFATLRWCWATLSSSRKNPTCRVIGFTCMMGRQIRKSPIGSGAITPSRRWPRSWRNERNMKSILAVFLGLVGLQTISSTARAQSAEEVGKLLDQLKDKDISVRQTALRELAQLGPQAREAVPVLVRYLGEQNEEHR